MQLTNQLNLDLFGVGLQNDPLLDTAPELLLRFLTENLADIAFNRLFEAFKNQDSMLCQTMLRMAINTKEKGKPFQVSIQLVRNKCQTIINNRRKKFVRRVVKSAPLFALELIRERYPDYAESMIPADLKLSKNYKRRAKFIKRPSAMGLRINQIRKLGNELYFTDPLSKEYNKYCNQIAGYHNGLKNKLPIQLTVSYNKQQQVYTFPWNATELRIKSFVALTKTVHSFEELDHQLAVNQKYGC